jgi:hypothetical protein
MAVPFLPVFSAGQILTSANMNQTSEAVNSLGMFFVKSQTVGAGVPNVTVPSAFSSDFESYRIIYSGGSQSLAGEIRMHLGSSVSLYYSSIVYATWTGATGGTGGNGIAYWNVGSGRPAGNSVCIDIHRPFATDETWFNGSYIGIDAGSVGGSVNGFHNNATSFTAFTLTPSAGTLSGGVIRVYGYRNSYS